MTEALAPALGSAADASWCSAGMPRLQALRQWQDWAALAIAPIDVTVAETSRFAARWRSSAVGSLRLLHLGAPAQKVVHRGGGAGAAGPSIQLVYFRRGAADTRIGGERFTVGPGEFVLLDNSRFYEMEMQRPHEAIDLVMPRGWTERWLPLADRFLARPISTRAGWGRPLGSLIEAMAGDLDACPLPRALLADQVGALLMLAGGPEALPAGRHQDELTRRILRAIERDFADPDLAPEGVAATLDMSKRHLQALLASRGTSFVRELTARRLTHAELLLRDPLTARLAVSEVAFRCGILDAGYFTRLFRRRHGLSPRDWRSRGLA